MSNLTDMLSDQQIVEFARNRIVAAKQEGKGWHEIVAMNPGLTTTSAKAIFKNDHRQFSVEYIATELRSHEKPQKRPISAQAFEVWHQKLLLLKNDWRKALKDFGHPQHRWLYALHRAYDAQKRSKVEGEWLDARKVEALERELDGWKDYNSEGAKRGLAKMMKDDKPQS
jgi:hypothetical protein